MNLVFKMMNVLFKIMYFAAEVSKASPRAGGNASGSVSGGGVSGGSPLAAEKRSPRFQERSHGRYVIQ